MKKIGVGLNSREGTVGNIGSALRFDYTVRGGRERGLPHQGMSKDYGVSKVVGEATLATMADAFDFTSLDCPRPRQPARCK